MSAFALKLIAIITMTIDHVGAVLLPEYFILRIIGRVSFPIFAFLIANGYHHTKDIKKYAGRLLLFAFISQYPFSKAFEFAGLNIFFTLFLGLLALLAYDKIENQGAKYGVIAVLALAAEFLSTDYGYFGVILILLFHVFRDSIPKMIGSIIVLNLIFSGMSAWHYRSLNPSLFVECVSVLGLIFVTQYNGQRGRSLKYFFYIFYPAHLMILYLLKAIV